MLRLSIIYSARDGFRYFDDSAAWRLWRHFIGARFTPWVAAQNSY
jgi:hypothetical protein